jgi:putative transposase
MKPDREHATRNDQTYFVTANTWQRRAVFQKSSWAHLFLNTLHSYRGRAYLLHEYVLMPEHFHILLTPMESLERAVQFLKGGFSFRAKKELESSLEVWQRGFSDHRIRDSADCEVHVGYIMRNPIGRRLVEHAVDYPYCSAFPGSEKDEVPQRLKPLKVGHDCGTAEAVPFQNRTSPGASAGEGERKR